MTLASAPAKARCMNAAWTDDAGRAVAHIDRKHQLYAHVSLLGRALGQQTRLEIIEILAQCPRTVEMLSNILHTDIKSVSAHLKVLLKAGLVTAQRRGRFRRYAVASPRVLELAVLLGQTARETETVAVENRRKAIEDAGSDRTDSLPDADLDVDTALECARRHELTLLDVRPTEEFAAAHLPHAVSMPLETLEAHIDELPSETPCAAYCRGSYCFLAQKAADVFARHGRKLLIVREGVLDWLGGGRAGLLESDAKGPKKPVLSEHGT